MESPRRSRIAAPLTALVFTVVPAALLTQCGIWPSFDPALVDAGFDAQLDASSDGGSDGGDGATDSPADSGLRPGGFRMCTPPAGPFVPQRVSDSASSARALRFNGRGGVVVGGTNLVWLNDMGETVHTTDPIGVTGVYGLAYRPDGTLLLATVTDLYTVDADYNVELLVPQSAFGAEGGPQGLRGLEVHPNGTVYVSDVNRSMVYRLPPGSRTPEMLAGVEGATGLALTPDRSQLYVGGGRGKIFVVDLTATGEAMAPARLYVDMGLGYGEGLAFDACGSLYATDRGMHRIRRIGPGGAPVEVIVDTHDEDAGMFGFWGLTFGRGGAFNPQALYVTDYGPGAIYRIDVGVDSADSLTTP